LHSVVFCGFLAPLAPLAPPALPTAPLLDFGADTDIVVALIATDVAVLDGLSEAVLPPSFCAMPVSLLSIAVNSAGVVPSAV